MKFIDEEKVLERIDKNDPYYNDIEEFIQDEHLINELVEGEITSMRENREQIIFSCGNHVIHPVERKTETEAEVFYNMPFIEKICLGTSPRVAHFHGVYLSYQSEQDKRAHADFFNNGFRIGCAVGVDGIHCITPLNRLFKIPWNENFYDKLKKDGINVIPKVKHIMCYNSDVLSGNNRECAIKLKDGLPEQRKVVSEYIIEQRGGVQPWVWGTEKINIPFIERSFSKMDNDTVCTVIDVKKPKRGGVLEYLAIPFKSTFKDRMRSVPTSIKKKIVGNDKRILSCFFTPAS